VPITMRGNWLFVQPGDPAYKVASNYTNYLELGTPGQTAYHLVARIEEGEFLVTAQLVNPADGTVQIVDNFPETSEGLERRMTSTGYQIVGPSGNLVLGIELLDERTCLLRGTIVDKSGEVVAKDEGDDFLVFRGPAILGKAGDSIGIMIS
jgi:hypothetical protein